VRSAKPWPTFVEKRLPYCFPQSRAHRPHNILDRARGVHVLRLIVLQPRAPSGNTHQLVFQSPPKTRDELCDSHLPRRTAEPITSAILASSISASASREPCSRSILKCPATERSDGSGPHQARALSKRARHPRSLQRRRPAPPQSLLTLIGGRRDRRPLARGLASRRGSRGAGPCRAD
jgi:hypothetical protein